MSKSYAGGDDALFGRHTFLGGGVPQSTGYLQAAADAGAAKNLAKEFSVGSVNRGVGLQDLLKFGKRLPRPNTSVVWSRLTASSAHSRTVISKIVR
jgi:hypothetical protein